MAKNEKPHAHPWTLRQRSGRAGALVGLLGLFGLLGLLSKEFMLIPDGHLHLHILDIGQGDSILLVSPSGKQILIDGGPDLTALERMSEHMPFFDRTIELLVLTHPDSDHISALPEVLERYDIDAALISGIEPTNAQYRRFLTLLSKHEIRVVTADPSKDIDLGDGLLLDVVWPLVDTFGTAPKSPNDTSVVLRALFKEHSILLTGDIEEDAELGILKSGADIRSKILKVAHHGSKTSSGTGFLLAVQPELALISVGRGNRYGHPHDEVMSRLHGLGVPARRTQKEGTIEITLGNDGGPFIP